MPEVYTEHLIAELQSHGVTDYYLDDQGKHYKLRFVWQGKSLMHVFPRSPSDGRRGLLNCLSDLRKQLGTRRIIQKSARDHKRRKRRLHLPEPPLTLTVKDDPFAVLACLRNPVGEEVKCPRMTLAQIAEILRAERLSAG
jgi:hypothetical protein